MKRCWLGFGLLLLLLTLSLVITAMMTRIHEDTERDLTQSAQCALLGEWENVDLFLRRAHRSWRKWAHFRSALADHEPLEDIDAAFEVLFVYRQARDATAYRAACVHLAKQMDALGESHRPVWWNLL